jgi:shikimate dehydrogenase
MPSAIVADGVDRFLRAEVGPLDLASTDGPGSGLALAGVAIAGIGTTAPKAVRGTLLAEALEALGYPVASATPYGSPAELMADRSWQLGVVLSPWKRDVGAHCDRLAPSAALTGVVDTVLRTPVGTFGFNTNTWASLSALELLLGGTEPQGILILGSGASARSVALAARRGWPACPITVSARSVEAALALARQFPGVAVAGPGGGEVPAGPAPDVPAPDVPAPDVPAPDVPAPDVVVNTTTWGETEASEAEPLGIDLDGVLRAGARVFDLNNRVGALPVQALSSGCAVLSGGLMQRVTNASRAALLAYAAGPV